MPQINKNDILFAATDQHRILELRVVDTEPFGDDKFLDVTTDLVVPDKTQQYIHDAYFKHIYPTKAGEQMGRVFFTKNEALTYASKQVERKISHLKAEIANHEYKLNKLKAENHE